MLSNRSNSLVVCPRLALMSTDYSCQTEILPEVEDECFEAAVKDSRHAVLDGIY